MKYDIKNINDSTKIEDIKILSLRARNLLVSIGINTMKDLKDYWDQYGEKGIRTIKGLGLVTYNDIYDFLHTEPPKSNFNVIKNLIYSDTELQNTPIENIKYFASTRTINGLKRANINTLKDLVNAYEEYGIEELRKFRTIGGKACYEINNLMNPQEGYNLDNVVSHLKNINVPEEIDEDEEDKKAYFLDYEPTKEDEIKKLKSDIKKYKLAIARTKIKIEKLKKANQINKKQKENEYD